MTFLCCPFVYEFSVGIRVFCHRTESDILFLLVILLIFEVLNNNITTGEWTCVISFARTAPTCKVGKPAKNKKKMSPPGIKLATLGFPLSGQLFTCI